MSYKHNLLLVIIILFIISCGDGSSDNNKSSNKNKIIKLDKASLQKGLGLQHALQLIAKKISPSVVEISGKVKNNMPKGNHPFFDGFRRYHEKFFNQRDNTNHPESIKNIGSGFIVDQNGFVVTNYQVIKGAEQIIIKLHDGKKYSAQVWGTDEISDIALLKINVNIKLPFLTINQTYNIKVGDFAIAIGSPFGLSGSMTVGIISAVGRDDLVFDRNAAFKHFIQTDASINRGSSGGPLLNIKGEVVGVTTITQGVDSHGSLGISFAIPVSIAGYVVEELKKHRVIERGFIGIIINNLSSSISKHLNIKTNGGVIVQNVQTGGPAHKGNMKNGDIITAVNKKKVKNTASLIQSVSNIKPGKTANFDIIRNGKKIKLKIIIGKRPKLVENWIEKSLKNNGGEENLSTWMGMSFGSIERYKNKFHLKVQKGVVIVKIDHNSPVLKSSIPLNVGDVIESIDYNQINDLQTFYQFVQQNQHKKSFIVTVVRNGRRFFTVIQK